MMFLENDDSAGESEAAAYQSVYPAPQDEPIIDAAAVRSAQYEGAYGIDTTSSEILQNGTRNSPALVSDRMQSSGAADSPFSGITRLLGSIGTAARDIGTAVGTVQRSVSGAPADYDRARLAAKNDNKLSQWWQYASTTDKITVGIGVLGLFFLLKKG